MTPLRSPLFVLASGEKRKAALGTSSTFCLSLVTISAVAVMPGRSVESALSTVSTAVYATTVLDALLDAVEPGRELVDGVLAARADCRHDWLNGGQRGRHVEASTWDQRAVVDGIGATGLSTQVESAHQLDGMFNAFALDDAGRLQEKVFAVADSEIRAN